MQHPLITYIQRIQSLSEEAQQQIIDCCRSEELPKGYEILQAGKTCQRLYFIEQGAVRTFFYQKDKDVTYWIYPENQFFASWHSYYLRKPSTEYIETTEPSIIHSISHENWQELFLRYPELNKFMRVEMEQQLAMIDDFYKGYYFLTAKEKYELLIHTFPEILQRANLGHVASMLGISQETLSRVRGKS